MPASLLHGCSGHYDKSQVGTNALGEGDRDVREEARVITPKPADR